MGLDKANIFKLNKEEFEKYKRDPFLDCFESTKIFAKALKYDIDTKETPHSLLLSANYGMGKTFFSTRFAQYLRKYRYDVIYFSVWENDYMQEPFLAFTKVIVSYIHNRFKANKYKDNIVKLFGKTQKIVSSITFTTGIGMSISADKLIKSFKTQKDPIIEFRKQLTSLINKTSKKKLIIIVDELDRCRPDYAMKTLECIKHFFDIEGLFIILPTNKDALNDCIKSLYGIDNRNRNCKENYFQKFFNDERIIKAPTEEDYLYIIKQYISQDKLKEALDKNLLSETFSDYNSIQNLQIYFAKYAKKANLTVREVKDFSLELVRICNHFYEPIRTEWLACVFAYKEIARDSQRNFQYPIPSEHCLYSKPFSNIENSNNGKTVLLSLDLYTTELSKLNTIYERDFHNNYYSYKNYYQLINQIKDYPKDLKTYLDTDNFFKQILHKINDFESNISFGNLVSKNFNIIKLAIENQKNAIQEYRDKYGSDDRDIVRRQEYIDIVNNPELIYSFQMLPTR